MISIKKEESPFSSRIIVMASSESLSTSFSASKEQLAYIYENKTGALIEASMMIGAVLAGADNGIIEKIRKTAYNVGMAFQIQDDILDEFQALQQESEGHILHFFWRQAPS